jgi:gluconate 2-dehydrogenase gamma chain
MKDDTTHTSTSSAYETFVFPGDAELEECVSLPDSLPSTGSRARDHAEHSRRAFLRALAGIAGGAWLGLDWSEIATAHEAPASTAASPMYTPFLTPPEAADVEAIAAQIIPTDTTPGAREAGIATFIDRALATYFARIAPTFRIQLTEFRALCRERHPQVGAFAALSSGQQMEFLKSIDATPFFGSMRLLTVIGMFAMPQYGGNRDGIGWKLLGFEDRHVFMPPFGYYDANYPGFELAPQVRA